MRRSEQRRAAAFALYEQEATGKSLDDVLGHNSSPLTRSLAHAAAARIDELDAIIARHSHGWTVDRIAPLERSIMRVALVEMLYPQLAGADHPIPPEGAIDEAVQSAKTFCGVDAPGFVNGILAAALRAVRDNQSGNVDQGGGEPAAAPPIEPRVADLALVPPGSPSQ